MRDSRVMLLSFCILAGAAAAYADNDTVDCSGRSLAAAVKTAPSAILSDVSTTNNGVHGLDLETGSSATVTDTPTASTNRVFGITCPH
jgi:hypothetical protein